MPAALLILGCGVGEAQQLVPKRALPVFGVAGCPAAQPHEPPQAAARERARALLARAQQAVLADEDPAAAAWLAEAASLDPSDPEVAYQHARLLEERGDGAGAAGEFCRFLALAPDSPDAADVRVRLAVLAAAAPGPAMPPDVAEQFGNGIVYLEREQFRAAVRAFTYVIQQRPEVAEAHFNRGISYLGTRRPALASRDLEAYLSLTPDAPDRAAVLQQMQAALHAHRYSAQGVFVRGIVVPGLGQFATHRPLQGALVTLTAGSALAIGLQSREVERTATFLDPFNNPREYARMETDRPYMVGGIAAAVAVTAMGALEAYLHVRRTDDGARRGAEAERLRPVIGWGARGTRLGISLSSR